MALHLKPWQKSHAVVVEFNGAALDPTNVTNVADQSFNLNRQLEDVQGIYLAEYYVSCAGGATRNVWRVDLSGNNMPEEESSNIAAGRGAAIVIGDLTNAVPNHVVYEPPRLISDAPKRQLNSLRVHITTDTGVAPLFNTIYLRFLIVYRPPDWSLAQVAVDDANRNEWWRSDLYSTRMHQ